MTVAQEPAAASDAKTHFVLRRLHSLMGVLFGGYIIVHLLVNATLVEGARHDGEPTVYQMQVDKIHSLPFLEAIEWTAILLPIIYHTIYGVYVVFRGRSNVGSYGYGRNWAYVLQRLTAAVLFFFIAFHVLGMKGALGETLTFDPAKATETTIRHINAHWTIAYLVYPLGILAATFHLANGFWAGGIAWGLTVSSAAQRRWGLLCAALFVLTFACGMASLIACIRGGVIAVT